MDRGIQPIHYINTDAALCKDFTTAFRSVLKENIEDESKSHICLCRPNRKNGGGIRKINL